MTNDFSGGLRGLRPPATFLQPFGLRWGVKRWVWNRKISIFGQFSQFLSGMSHPFRLMRGGLRLENWLLRSVCHAWNLMPDGRALENETRAGVISVAPEWITLAPQGMTAGKAAVSR